MISAILAVLGGGGVGGILGLIGTGINSFMEYKNRKLSIEETKIRREYDLKELEAEAIHAEKLALVRANMETELSADDNFQSSHENDTALEIGRLETGGIMAGFLVFTEGARRITRPALTWYLTSAVTALAGYITYKLYTAGVEASLPEMIEMLKYIVTSTVTVFCMAVSWWFGSRWKGPSK